ncbi:MAG: Lactate utilization protein [Planctomycetota bacterium]|jgi:L-lactate dehydrogenase complex protein LldE
MRVGLFIPCYVDQFYPDVGMATVEVLEKLNLEVDFPAEQTCCGQPMLNTGCTSAAVPLAKRFVEIFAEYDYVVCPSGSCTSMVRNHFHELLHDDPGYLKLQKKSFELCEFLHDVLGLTRWEGEFPYRVGIHQSCHGLRELRLEGCSEEMRSRPQKVKGFLSGLTGIEFTQLKRPDECCGFGGTFAVAQEAISVMMGDDRLEDHQQAGTEVLTATDMSCLMHMEGIIRRNKIPMAVMHVAEILAGRKPTKPWKPSEIKPASA